MYSKSAAVASVIMSVAAISGGAADSLSSIDGWNDLKFGMTFKEFEVLKGKDPDAWSMEVQISGLIFIARVAFDYDTQSPFLKYGSKEQAEYKGEHLKLDKITLSAFDSGGTTFLRPCPINRVKSDLEAKYGQEFKQTTHDNPHSSHYYWGTPQKYVDLSYQGDPTDCVISVTYNDITVKYTPMPQKLPESHF